MGSGQIREIKKKIGSIKNTRQITKAMEMVSSAKFKKMNKLVIDSRPYYDGINGILKNIAAGLQGETHPLLEGKNEVKRVGVIALTSDRGLCGSFNSSIIKAVNKYAEENKDKEVSLIAVGKKIRDYCKNHNLDMKAEYIQLVPEIMFDKAKEIGENAVEFFLEDIFDEVYIVYSKFISAAKSEVKMDRILPVEEIEVEENSNYIFEPSEEEILGSLLPKYLNITIYQSLLESAASEHSARMRAMKSASDNANEIISALTLQYNRARQAAITQEIAEIVGGADALK